MSKTQLKYLKNSIFEQYINKKLKNSKQIMLFSGKPLMEIKEDCNRIPLRLLRPVNKYLLIKGVKYIYFDAPKAPDWPFARFLENNILFDNQRCDFINKNKHEHFCGTLTTAYLNFFYTLEQCKKK